MKCWTVILMKSKNDLLSDDNMHVADSKTGISSVKSCQFLHNTIVTAVKNAIQGIKV